MKRYQLKSISFILAVIMLIGFVPNVSADAPAVMEIAASEAQGVPGTSVNIAVTLRNNLGLTSLKIKVAFDTSILELKNIEICEDIASKCQPSGLSSPVTINYFDGANDYSGEAFAVLSFNILETAYDGDFSDIIITFDSDDIFDASEQEITVIAVNGIVRVISCIPGDINGDEKVNNKDLMRLFQHLSGLEVVVNEPALDTNGDGKVNNKDLMRLFQHLSGLDVELFPKPAVIQCRHEMIHHDAVAATCTENGSIEYYECYKCGKLFADAKGSTEITLADTMINAPGHTVVIDPAVPATSTTWGSTEGSHCSVCNTVIVAPQPIEPITPNTRSITYHIVDVAKHPYLATLNIDDSKLVHSYVPGETKTLERLDLELAKYGYTFDGWYEGFSENAAEIKRIESTDNEDKNLYAHVSEIEYDITYNLYQTPVTSQPTEKQLHYKVSQGNSNLYYPEINNYIFLGWYDSNGLEYKEIPIGTTGNITLYPYYTSLRNYAVSVVDDNPIILEDQNANVVYFTYELGEIRNIPLNGDDPFWEIQSVAGLSQQVSETYSTTISTEEASAISKTISDMTVNSSTWTLSESWNDVTTVNESWAESIGITSEKCKTEATTSSNTLSISNQTGGSSYHKTEDGATVYDYNSKTETKDKGHQFDANLSGKYSNKISANLGASNEYGTEGSFSASNAYTSEGKINANNWSASGSQSGSQSGSSAVSDKDKLSAGISYENGFEVSAGLHYGYHNNTNTVTKTGTDTVTVNSNIDENTSSWNNSATFSATQQHSSSQTVRNTLSDIVTTTKGYGSSYSNGGTDTNSQGFSSTASNTSGTTSSVTYSKTQTKTTTKTYGVNGKIEGKYRSILVGKAHVFAVVGYDYSTKSFFTYTFSVMDDRVEEFLDYTPKGGDYTDCENSCLPFEIPYFVFDYVSSKTAKTSGVNYITNSKTGTAKIVNYSGTEPDVIIPSYVSDGRQTYKVTEIGDAAFSGKSVRSVVVGEFIKTIPNRAFMNCTELEEVIGSFTEIGDEAFAGCTNLINMNVPSNVVKIGTDAFRGAYSVKVRAINSLSAYAQAVKEVPNGSDEQIEAKQKEITQRYIKSILDCGAENIVLDLSTITTGVELNLEVPEMASIEIDGGDRIYDCFRIDSSARETALRYLTITGSKGTPIITSSDKLTLQKVFLNANTAALIMKHKGATLSLVQDSSIGSSAEYSVIGNNLTIESQITNDGAVGFLSITGNFGYANEISGQEYVDISNGELKQISEEEFNNYVRGAFTLTFDPNYGTVNQTSKTVYYGNTYGELPVPHRDYYTFNGWFTDAIGGNRIDANTIVNINNDQTLYAHWDEIYVVRLDIVNNPFKTSYYQGDVFSTEGLAVNAVYNDGTVLTKTPAELSISAPDMNYAGIKSIAVSFGGQQTSYNIEIKELYISINVDSSTGGNGYVVMSANIPCGTVSWSSSDTNVARVDGRQVIFNRVAGTAIITATVNNNGVIKTASKTVTISNNSGTKFAESVTTNSDTILYGTHPDGYSTSIPVTTGTIPNYSTNAADVSPSSYNTSTGRVEIGYNNNGIDGYVYYQVNYNSGGSGQNNIYKIINYNDSYRNCYIGDGTTPSYAFYYSPFGRQFYSSTDYAEHDAAKSWTTYAANWWAYQDKQNGHTWYVAYDIPGALAASWYRFPLYKYTRTTSTYTYYYYSIG